MSAPQPPYGHGYPQQGQPPPQSYSPQQPGYPPQTPPQSQPQGFPQQPPGYPPQQYPQQQPHGGYPPTAYIAGGILGVGTLILVFVTFRFFQISIHLPVIPYTVLIWVSSVIALLAAVAAGSACALFFTRSHLAPRLAITAGTLSILVLAANLVDRVGSVDRQMEAVIACVLGMGMIAVGLFPHMRSGLKPKPQQPAQY